MSLLKQYCKYFPHLLGLILLLQVSVANASSPSAAATTLSSSVTTGLDVSLYSNASNYTLYTGGTSLWGNLQPSGFVEFAVNASASGAYAVQLYYSTVESGAGTNISINGSLQAAPSLASTSSWNSFQLSSPTQVFLPVGRSVIQVAAQASFHPYNLAGLLLSPAATSTSAPTPVLPAKPLAPVNYVSPTATTSLDLSRYSASTSFSFYPGTPSIWGNLQPGGYVEYTISASGGSYNLQLNSATPLSGPADILINNASSQTIQVGSTGSWNTYQTSHPVSLTLANGQSIIRIAADPTYVPFNLAGIILTPAPVAPLQVPASLNPLANVKFYVNPYSEAGQNSGFSCSSQYPDKSGLIAKIASQPQGVWFGDWNSNVQSAAASVVSAANAQHQVPIMVAYDIPLRDCNGYSGGGAASAAAYQSWIQGLALGIGPSPAVVVLEPDALSQLHNPGCLNAPQQAERLNLLNSAIATLHQYAPKAAVYLDAGHDNAIAAPDMASRLQQAGVSTAAGFALNTSYYGTTAANTAYGQQISSLTGGSHFIIDTSRNGLGPTPDGQWCNPSNRGLGSPSQGFASGVVDGYLWVQNPGTSDGTCNGGPPAGSFFGQQACTLAANATF